MSFGEQRTNLILVAGALILALLAGVAIPLSSGSQPGQKASPWTPPPTSPPTPRPTARPVQLPAATAAPTRAPVTPTPTPTVLPTAAIPSATAAPTGTPSSTSTASPPTATRPAPTSSPTPAAPGAPAAPSVTVREGPLILRTGPGTDYAIVALGNIGDTFAAIGRTTDNVWLRVCCIKDTPVWLAAEFVDMAGSVAGLPIVP